VIGIAQVYVFGDLLWRVVHDGSLLVLCISAALITLGAHWLRPHSVPGMGWLASMGRLSYEIYLSHEFLVLLATSWYASTYGKDMRWTVLFYPSIILVSYLLGHFLERGFTSPLARLLGRQATAPMRAAAQGT
jgi:peptidoglycan/LPS O-acetylase OafA/YrhL